MNTRAQFSFVGCFLLSIACGGSPSSIGGTGGSAGAGNGGTGPGIEATLLLNEVQSRNDGTWIDEAGQTDDWVEVYNDGSASIELSDFWIEDASRERTQLPSVLLPSGETLVLWADSDEEQGAGHLPFKLSGSGDTLRLSNAAGSTVDEIVIPALGANEVYARLGEARAWQRCKYASPSLANPDSCAPPTPEWLADNVVFEPFELTGEALMPDGPLILNELHLRPGPSEDAFVELFNSGSVALDLARYELRVSEHAPDQDWPEASDGELIPIEITTPLDPGEHRVIPVSSDSLLALQASEAFEGVVSLFERSLPGEVALPVLDRIDFMRWPEGSTIARSPAGSLRLCTNSTAGVKNECDELAQRETGDRLRHLFTPGDFAALSDGSTTVGIVSVKFVADLQAPGLVHLIGAARYPLHYTFVREEVYRQPQLDRCDSLEGADFFDGWVTFSQTEYYSNVGRRFLLGTLSKHSAATLNAVEFSLGDTITAEQMRQGFMLAVAHSFDPIAWSLRPQDEGQSNKVREIEGSLPLLSPNSPFQNLRHQPLNEGIGYGTLRYVPSVELGLTALGPEVIVVTDSVPNDIPLVGGLITEAFQTPLAHVNVLSQSRGTPNASLLDARSVLSDWFDRLVRVEVNAEGVHVTAAEIADATAYWEQFRPGEAVFSPRIDRATRGVQLLSEHGLASLPAIGAKASQLAELAQIGESGCQEAYSIRTPDSAFAVPVVHSSEHYAASGATTLLNQLATDPEFVADPLIRAEGLNRVRNLVLQHPVQAELLRDVTAAARNAYGEERVRFRSSSNTEDLPNFIGAGLYDSLSAEVDSDNRTVQDALRGVWASLYNARAYDERRLAGVVETDVAMGILVHQAFRDERANGVAVSRNLLDPIRGDIYFLNSQAGEASVTNPAPGLGTEQVIYRWNREPPILQKSQSSLLSALPGAQKRVLSDEEVREVSCALNAVHNHFSPLLDPNSENQWFAMEVEFKYLGPERSLLLKQARPHDFGRAPRFADCREF